MSKQPLTLHITLVVDPEQITKFYDALRPLHRMLVGEKECVYFNVFEVAGKPGTVRLVQIWDGDMHWMVKVQSKKEYYQTFLEIVKSIALEPQKVEVMNSVDDFRYMRS